MENSSAITFIRTDTEEVAAQDVRLIVAEMGPDKSAKNKPPVWARNTIIAGEKRYVSTCWPHENAANFEKWLSACPRAVGITTDGTIRVPQIAQPAGADSVALLRDALSEGRYVLGNYAAKAAAVSVPLLLVGATVIFGVLSYGIAHPYAPALFRFGIFGLLITGAGAYTGRPALALLKQWQHVTRLLTDLISRGEIKADLLKSVTPRPMPSV